ncbi:Ferredoxin--NADP reductase [Caldalkalibacillus thermarum TA2.A1]|uniref:Ferredoxin--NADP reductase n=1 Tax=Caldalkalibacillus thermarum (strain TA2.A1) TaxID=986075 RepID=F5L3B9_CALTT|nr:NAD(P)/FAD-dependent oxidoreductase [Caldalkalibacillus thermarum]EGL84166.1 Ferredoxin--NADP reductase [Caldalkalibacillus thermarum TA2.A1]QZT33636.1 NAD(P)/FAD-dependent oxidoreductase [Caldalkalibacillus thermarum TA2.A1]
MSQQQNRDVVDIAIIGGGPTGLFAAFYAGMRQASCKIIESMPQLGGQLSALYPEKYIYDVAGFPKVLAQDLVNYLKEQAFSFDTQVALEETVEDVRKNEEGIFEIKTNKGLHFSRTVIITAGCGAFSPRKLDVDGAEKFEDSNLHYFVKDKHAFKGKRVLISGGGDSAVDWALMLEPIAEKVTLVHRRDKFRAHEHSVEQLMNSKVDIKTPLRISELHGDDKIEKVVLANAKTNEKVEELEVDEVIVSFGFISSLGPIQNWGLHIEKGSIVVNSKMETNIPGIYAAGDIVTYPGKIKLIAVGFGEAPTAVNNAKAYLDPKAKVQPGHSSHMNFNK